MDQSLNMLPESNEDGEILIEALKYMDDESVFFVAGGMPGGAIRGEDEVVAIHSNCSHVRQHLQTRKLGRG
eukprot:7421236-Pyramimonas_sp.AAC.1